MLKLKAVYIMFISIIFYKYVTHYIISFSIYTAQFLIAIDPNANFETTLHPACSELSGYL